MGGGTNIGVGFLRGLKEMLCVRAHTRTPSLRKDRNQGGYKD